MGYAILVGPCAFCGAMVTCHPRKVPSYKNQPVCRGCVEQLNDKRAAAGLEPFPIPDGAYEPAEEGEI